MWCPHCRCHLMAMLLHKKSVNKGGKRAHKKRRLELHRRPSVICLSNLYGTWQCPSQKYRQARREWHGNNTYQPPLTGLAAPSAASPRDLTESVPRTLKFVPCGQRNTRSTSRQIWVLHRRHLSKCWHTRWHFIALMRV
jgi:hypothetical protein